MTQALLVQVLGPDWVSTVSRTPWAGVHPADTIEGGFVVITARRSVLLGVLAFITEFETGAQGFTLAVNPEARRPLSVADELVSHLPMQPWRQRNWVGQDSPEYQALAKHGCEVFDSSGQWQIELERAEDRLAQMKAILERRRPLRGGQRVITWQQELALEVRRITLEEKLSTVAQLDALLSPNTVNSLCPLSSTLAFDGDRLVGFFVTNIRDEICHIPVLWVAPEFRHSWVNARLMLLSLEARRPYHPQVTHLRFRGNDVIQKATRQICLRFGGSILNRRMRFSLASA